jgi:hypothetical protein
MAPAVGYVVKSGCIKNTGYGKQNSSVAKTTSLPNIFSKSVCLAQHSPNLPQQPSQLTLPVI